MSPFLRMIRADNGAEIYDNPSMAAVIDFKWNAARNHFLRHALIYVVFALLFAILNVIFPLVINSLDIYFGTKFPDPDEEPEKFQEQFVQITRDYRLFIIFNSFAVLVMWLELFLLLRYFERSGAYIYILVNIFKQIIPFLIFILVVVLGFGHAMFVLLNDTANIDIKPDGSSFTITPTNSDSDQPLPYNVEQFINVDSKSDNFYTNFIKSVESVFFWTGG
ncbi:hypothetical protein RhiirA1_474800, partial [Rhizophagus irregularis]